MSGRAEIEEKARRHKSRARRHAKSGNDASARAHYGRARYYEREAATGLLRVVNIARATRDATVRRVNNASSAERRIAGTVGALVAAGLLAKGLNVLGQGGSQSDPLTVSGTAKNDRVGQVDPDRDHVGVQIVEDGSDNDSEHTDPSDRVHTTSADVEPEPGVEGAPRIPTRAVLTNTGNTCYMNAVLQCLFRVDGLVFEDGAVSAAYAGLRQSWNRTVLISGDDMRSFAGVLGSVLSPGAQHDADEFLNALLFSMTQTSPLSFNMRVTSTREQPSGMVEQWSDLVSDKVDPSTVLHLPIEGPIGSVSLSSCLDNYTKDRAMPVDSPLEYDGPSGTIFLPGSQKYQFESLPAVLTIELKRFESNDNLGVIQKKIDTLVAFDERLDLARYRADRADATAETRYRLCGVVMHSGGHGGGHYWALVRDMPDGVGQGDASQAGQWRAYNDTDKIADMDISGVREEGLGSGHEGSPSAYILFYARLDPAALPGEKREPVGKGTPTDLNAPKSPNRPHAAQAVSNRPQAAFVAGMRRSSSRPRADPGLDPRKARR